jgi:hypothetical protein
LLRKKYLFFDIRNMDRVAILRFWKGLQMTGVSEVPEVFDDPVLQVALLNVWITSDISSEQGFRDGLEGRPMRPIPDNLPVLFVECYRSAYNRGMREREDRLNCQEIALLEEQRGLCHDGANKNDHSDPVGGGSRNTVEMKFESPTPNDKEGKQSIMNDSKMSANSSTQEQSQQQKLGFWESYGKIFVGSLALAGCTGAVCFAAGKKIGTRVQRDLGGEAKE